MKYAKNLSSVLSEKLTRLQASYYGRISLRDELAIFQHFMEEAVIRYDRAVQKQETETDPQKKLQAAAAVAVLMDQIYDAGTRVRDMAIAAQRLEEGSGTVSIGMVHGMMAQIVQIVDEEITAGAEGRIILNPQSMMFRITERARMELAEANIVAEQTTTNTTRLLPADEEAQAMDDTVPHVA